MVTILTSVAFRGAALIRGEALISMWIPKGAAIITGRRLFKARPSLEEIWYLLHSCVKQNNIIV